ncbi:MAG: nicotinate-nucleotide adenylyltransferase [Coriobacteriaceae bacterium]|nr:nicotinate-nucleotide adenylyltransferase [Coriobacteriaceae bacterium]
MKVCDRFDDLGYSDPDETYRLGIFGGTFDPVHVGHLAAAERVREQAHLDAVVFMPAGVPVFKLDQKVTSGEERLAMCRLATTGNPYFDVSDIEVRRAGNTYTYETLRELRAHYPANVQLFFIAGADAIITLGKWRNAKELTQLARFIAMTRPGYSQDEAKRAVYVDGERLDVDFLEVPGLNISSSYVRACVEDGRTIRYIVSDSVRDYIMSHGLYR